MTTPSPEVAEADRRFRLWMRRNLEDAAAHFGLAVAGEPVFGWRLRSVGAPAEGPGGRRWLRVVSEELSWPKGHAWTGNADADALHGLPRPRVIDVHEWDEGHWRRQRAEVMTFLPGMPCSVTDVPGSDLELSGTWWRDLARALDVLARTPTERISTDQAKVTRRVRAAFGDDTDVRVERWETVHGDLHWANLLRSPLGILDWELWGRGPAGTDAATLHCYSLAVPELARRVREHFPVLETEHGRRAQLYVTARLLHRAGLGDHPQLAAPLREHARSLLGG
ncbi:aminoglycoside phosphotransferase [Streptomyces sp. URMC 129]|uniref:aminoglycoside phosphotransferase n=1 Tax=Streptomyces sp. URMC 129 TaxID=3423407 RepID=UPI003F1AB414